jgi:hypothetical protein
MYNYKPIYSSQGEYISLSSAYMFNMLKVLQIKTVDPSQVRYKMYNVNSYFL